MNLKSLNPIQQSKSHIWAFSIILISFIFWGTSCNSEIDSQVETHRADVDAWHQDRLERLSRPDGWLRLAGLEWIEEGEHQIGTGREAAVKFPDSSVPSNAGILRREGHSVFFQPNEEINFMVDGEAFTGGIIYDGDEALTLSYDRVIWTIVQRNDLVGVRIFDLESPYYTNFTELERFPVDINWRKEARFIPHQDSVFINMVDILGEITANYSPGQLVFEHNGIGYTLDTVDATDSFFIIFADPTNRTSTYGMGRFLYADKPEDGDLVVLDFNKSYNPPCALTPFTLCLLPPEQNRLDFSVEAGEKRYEMWVE